AQAELAEHAAQVALDGPRAEEQRRGDVLVGPALGDRERDLQLLRRQVAQAGRGRRRGSGAARPELALGALLPRRRAEPPEDVRGLGEREARLAPPTLAPQPLTDHERR